MFDRMYSPVFRLLTRLPTPAMRRYRRIEADLHGAIDAMIARRREEGARVPRDDLLSLLLRAREGDAGMTDERVRDEALTLFLAGHETTANALAWTWWWLDRTPDVEAALHAELDQVLGDRPPTVDDLPRLPVADAVLSESIRLRPPAWAIGRRAVGALRVGAVAIPAGSVVVVSPWLLHHDARWWPEPESFRIDRWSPAAKAARRRGAYLPFGAGPRVCIGEPFARMEGVLVLASIARRWRLRLDPAIPVEMQAVVTLRPRSGIRMRLEPRDGARA
jgi:cytochrome P450